jgi:hypothetical protein
MRLVAAGVLALVLTACITPGHDNADDVHCLIITCFPSQLQLGRYPLPADGFFSLSFIHSVSKTPVRDDYHIVDSRIVQVAETFQAHGAGLPSGIDEVGVTRWEHHDGKFVIRMERPISRLIVRTDRNYRNRLHIDGRNINLNQWDDQALELAIVPCATPE